ncbi:MAG: CRISPR-associated endonuclease Cas2, partial [Myxococcota bacterium]
RSVYLVAYDISDDKRRESAFRTLRGFGDHLQYSVFRVDASETELVRLRARLTAIIDHKTDRVLLADLGPSDGRGATAMSTLGVPSETSGGRSAIIW